MTIRVSVVAWLSASLLCGQLAASSLCFEAELANDIVLPFEIVEKEGASGGLAGDFGAHGTWYYDQGVWEALSTSDPERIAGWGAGLAADFGSWGLWNHNGTDWQHLAGAGIEGLVGWSGGLAVDYGIYGFWNYDGAAWTLLSGADPQDLAGWSGGLAGDFGVYGLWNYDGAAWQVMQSGTNVSLQGVWGSAPDNVFVVGEAGTVLHYTGVVPVEDTSWGRLKNLFSN